MCAQILLAQHGSERGVGARVGELALDVADLLGLSTGRFEQSQLCLQSAGRCLLVLCFDRYLGRYLAPQVGDLFGVRCGLGSLSFLLGGSCLCCCRLSLALLLLPFLQRDARLLGRDPLALLCGLAHDVSRALLLRS